MKKLIIISFLLLFFSIGSSAQKIWTLEDCIGYALENNIQVKQQQLNTVVSKLTYNQKIASLFPSINGNYHMFIIPGKQLTSIPICLQRKRFNLIIWELMQIWFCSMDYNY